MRDGWEIKKLGEVCIVERGGSPRPIESFLTDAEDGINWIKIGDATSGSKYITSTKEKIKPEGVKKSRMVYKGDFILSNSMSFGKPYILGIDGCIHDGWLVLRDNSNLFDKSFLYYYLSSPNIYREFKKLAVGGVVNNLNSELVRGVNVVIPPLPEQERIVAELDSLSSIIEKKKQQLKEYDTLAQSIFYDMFGDISDHVSLSVYIKSLAGGKSLAGTDDNVNKVLKTGAVTYDYFKADEVKDLPLDYTPREEHLLNDGDLLISRMNTLEYVGACAYVWTAPKNTYLPDRLWRATLKDNVNPIYLWYSIVQPKTKEQIRDLASGTSGSMKNISIPRFLSVKIINAPLPLQQSFASKVEAIEKQKAILKKSIEEAETLFNSRMDYYFN